MSKVPFAWVVKTSRNVKRQQSPFKIIDLGIMHDIIVHNDKNIKKFLLLKIERRALKLMLSTYCRRNCTLLSAIYLNDVTLNTSTGV